MRTWLARQTPEAKAKHAAYVRGWRERNKERFKATQRRAYLNNKIEVLSHYSRNGSPECCCCGETELSFLTIDHVNNDGAAHRRAIVAVGKKISGNGFYYWLKKNGFPKEFQTLCMNCQFGKKIEGVCPHEKARLASA